MRPPSFLNFESCVVFRPYSFFQNIVTQAVQLICAVLNFRLHEQLQEDDEAAVQYSRYVEQTEAVGVRKSSFVRPHLEIGSRIFRYTLSK